MKHRRVIVTPDAIDDLVDIHNQISMGGGSAVADRYIERLRTFVNGFDIASERGTPRPDLREGLRAIGYERRITITFAVFEEHVDILRFFWGGQNWEDNI
jgi:toxin ParE1/3/4